MADVLVLVQNTADLRVRQANFMFHKLQIAFTNESTP